MMEKKINNLNGNAYDALYGILLEQSKLSFEAVIDYIEAALSKAYDKFFETLETVEEPTLETVDEPLPRPIKDFYRKLDKIDHIYMRERKSVLSNRKYLSADASYYRMDYRVDESELTRFFSTVKSVFHEQRPGYGYLVFFDNESNVLINTLSIRDIMTVSEMTYDIAITSDIRGLDDFNELIRIVKAYRDAEVAAPISFYTNYVPMSIDI